MRLPVCGIAVLSLVACSGRDSPRKPTALEASCVGTAMPAATCACLDETAQATLDARLYEMLTKASAEAEAARKAEGSEDGMMDRLPRDMDAGEEAQITKFLQKLRSDCREGLGGS